MIVAELVVATVCMIASFLFSAAEGALLAVQNRTIDDGRPGSSRSVPGRGSAMMATGTVVEGLLGGRSRRTMATILVANLTANAVLTALVTVSAVRGYGGFLGALLAALAISAFVTIAGEILPKVLATKYPARVARLTAPPVALASALLRPVTSLADRVVRLVTQGEYSGDSRIVTEEELRGYLALSSSEGVLGAGESEMIDSIFEFGDTAVHEVMTPRRDIHALPETADLDSVRTLLASSQRSRIPVYRGDLDDVTGVLYVKDLLPYVTGARAERDFRLVDVLRKPHFVPEVMKCDDLLRDLRQQGRFLAVVVDEYGGTAGIITMEDLLEEIVGDIRDEYDNEEPPMVEVVDEGSFRVDARLHVKEAEESLPFEFPDGDFDTVGGFVFNGLGHLPEVGEEFVWNGWCFRIVIMDGHRIRRIDVQRHEGAS